LDARVKRRPWFAEEEHAFNEIARAAGVSCTLVAVYVWEVTGRFRALARTSSSGRCIPVD
jgi:hypothetical protein